MIACVVSLFNFVFPCTESSDYIEKDLSGDLNIMIIAPYGGVNTLNGIIPEVSDRHDGCYDDITNTCVYQLGCTPPDSDR